LTPPGGGAIFAGMNAPGRPSSPPLRAVRTVAKCPVCSRPASEARYQPFCTKRCADIDLGRWLKESYRVPTDEPADDGGGETADSRPPVSSGQDR
jgi:uncharacterized protein